MIDRLMRTLRQLKSHFTACNHIRFLLSKSMDENLSWRKRLRVATHLVTCSSCTHYRQHLHIIRGFINCYRAKHPEPEGSYWKLSIETRVRMKKLIREKINKQREKNNGRPLRSVNYSPLRPFRSCDAFDFVTAHVA
jgi:hypothetical protein